MFRNLNSCKEPEEAHPLCSLDLHPLGLQVFLKASMSRSAAASQGTQVELEEFHIHFTPGTAITHSRCSEKAAQLAGVNLSTSPSIRLLKPPYTYITLTRDTQINLGMREDRGMKAEEEVGRENEEEHKKGVMNVAYGIDKSNRKSCVVPLLHTKGSVGGQIDTDNDAGVYGYEYRSQ